MKPWGWTLIAIAIAAVVGAGVATGIYFGIVKMASPKETNMNDAEKQQGVDISATRSTESPNEDKDEAATHSEEDKPMPGEPVDPVAPSSTSPGAGDLPCSQTPQLTALETNSALSSEPFSHE